MDIFKIFVILVLGFLLYREFTRKKTNTIEKLDVAGVMEISDNSIKFNKPIECDRINMGGGKFSVSVDNPTSDEHAHFVIRNNKGGDVGDTRFAMSYSLGNFSMSRNAKNLFYGYNDIGIGDHTVQNGGNVYINKDLLIGQGPHQWHIRNKKLGVTGKCDISIDDDNWIRILGYNGGSYWGNGIGANRLWANVVGAETQLDLGRRLFTDENNRLKMVNARNGKVFNFNDSSGGEKTV